MDGRGINQNRNKEEMTDRDFINRAIEIACRNASSADGGPFGAVIVKNGTVIAEAGNSVTSGNDPTAHAEINAIRQACKALNTFSLAGCTIYSSCEPCPMCLSAIYWSRMDRICYASDRHDAALAGFDDETIYREIGTPQEKRMIRTERLLSAEGREPFRLWLENKDKTRY